MNTTTVILIIVFLAVILLIQAILKSVFSPKNEVRGIALLLLRLKKLVSAFARPRIDKNAHLSELELRKYSLGNLYVFQQNGTLNTFSTGVDASVRKMVLSEYWGIKSREDAVSMLQYLSRAPSHVIFDYAYKAFMEGEKTVLAGEEELKEYPDFLEKCEEYLEKLREYGNYFVEWELVESKEALGRLGVLAWDAGRLNFIARLCLEQDYISDAECKDCVEAAYEMTKDAYRNWTEYADSYVIGRTLSMGTSDMIGLAKDLLTDPNSPWTYIEW